MIVYTNLFTLSNKEPSENRYIDMFWIWCHFLEKYGGLTTADKVYVLVDSRTCDYMEKIIKFLPTKLNYCMIEYAPPRTVLEGILRRYTFLSFPFLDTSQAIMYLDLDILCVNSIQPLSTIEENSFYVSKEDKLLDLYHLGEVISAETYEFIKEKNLTDLEGYTAGWFLFKGEKINDLFTEIVMRCKNGKKNCITCEQPYFCYVVFDIQFRNTIPGIKIHIADSEFFENNISFQTKKKETIFLNYCGNVGDYNNHWLKLFGVLLSTS